MKSYKFLLIVGDGMGDRPIPELNFKTPLEYAVTPNLDSLAKRGITGI
ncbi:MAG: phosphoglycerate mutase, partial [Candidatus Methanomethylicota archaeon]